MTSKVTRAPSRSKSFWHQHIQQWKNSGQSKARYCREHGLNAGTFYNWCSDEAAAGTPISDSKGLSGQVKLLPVTLRQTSGSPVNSYPPSVTLEHSLGRFIFPNNLSAESIDQWLRAIGQSDV